MSNTEVVIPGVLNPDGTLQLQHAPALAAGPVEVVIRPAPVATNEEGWWDYLQRARAELEAKGTVFASGEEVDALIKELRSGDDRIESIYHGLASKKKRAD